jgi:hypothetical protein
MLALERLANASTALGFCKSAEDKRVGSTYLNIIRERHTHFAFHTECSKKVRTDGQRSRRGTEGGSASWGVATRMKVFDSKWQAMDGVIRTQHFIEEKM